MIYVLLGECVRLQDDDLHNILIMSGILFGFLFLMFVTLVCLISPVVTRYLEARRMLAKAAQYRPSKYKQVSPATTPITVSVSGVTFRK